MIVLREISIFGSKNSSHKYRRLYKLENYWDSIRGCSRKKVLIARYRILVCYFPTMMIVLSSREFHEPPIVAVGSGVFSCAVLLWWSSCAMLMIVVLWSTCDPYCTVHSIYLLELSRWLCRWGKKQKSTTDGNDTTRRRRRRIRRGVVSCRLRGQHRGVITAGRCVLLFPLGWMMDLYVFLSIVGFMLYIIHYSTTLTRMCSQHLRF